MAREIYKRRIDHCTIINSTYLQSEYVKATIARAKAMSEDSNRKERLEVAECVVCYGGGKAGGSMCTSVLCGVCEKVMQFGNTCVDATCLECAKQYNLCKHCGSDIDLKQRKKMREFLKKEVLSDDGRSND